MVRKRRRLVERVHCPSCWATFSPEEAFHIAQHPELLGDDVLGPNEFKRFPAKHFTVDGAAYDEKGALATGIACPHCHFRLCDPIINTPMLFISLIGAPASGKSYFLTSLVERLATLLPRMNLAFGDADTLGNQSIHTYQNTLFHNPVPDKEVDLRKTLETAKDLYRRVTLDEIENVVLPIPMQFLLSLLPAHPHANRPFSGRILTLYDNAGEDFIPTAEKTSGAHAIRHVAQSDFLLMFYDLSQDNRWVHEFGAEAAAEAVRKRLPDDTPIVRQDAILRTAITRIRQAKKLSEGERTDQPLYIVIPKFDLWADQLGVDINEEPLIEKNDILHFNPARVKQVSDAIRKQLVKHCGDFVATAESFSSTVQYIPVSALGYAPEFVTHENGFGFFGVRPQDIRPKWVTVPLLNAMNNRYVDLFPMLQEE